MLFGFWQLKTTVYILFLASCLGQELFHICERDYCYERSIENRKSQPNDLREWYDFNGKNFAREDGNDRIREIDERRVDNLSSETNRENIRLTEHRQHHTKNDSTSRLDNKREERREALTRFNERTVTRLSDDKREKQLNECDETNRERKECFGTLRRLDNVNAEKRSEIDRKNKQELMENRENLRRLNERDVTKRSEDKREGRSEHLLQLEERKAHIEQDVMRVPTNNRKERHANLKGTVTRRLDDNRKEHETLIRHDDHGAQRDVSRRFDNNGEQFHKMLRRLDEHKDQRDNKRLSKDEFKEPNSQAQRTLIRRLEKNSENNQHVDKRISQRKDDFKKRSENTMERVKSDESIRQLDDREDVYDANRLSEDNRLSAEYTKYNRVEHHRDLGRVNERSEEQRRENIRLGKREIRRDTPESRLKNEGLPKRERESTQHRDKYEIELHESLKRLDDRGPLHDDSRYSENFRQLAKNDNPVQRQHILKTLNERLENNREERENLRLIERNVPREAPKSRQTNERHELTKLPHEYKQERVGRLNELHVQRDVSKHLEVNRQLAENNEIIERNYIWRRLNERSEDNREQRRESLKHLEESYALQSHRTNEHESLQRRNKRNVSQLFNDNREERYQISMRLDENESQRDTSRRSEDNSKERQQNLRKIDEYDLIRRSEHNREDVHENLGQLGERDVSRRSDDIRERINERLFQIEFKSTQRRDESKVEVVEERLDNRGQQQVTIGGLDNNHEERYETLRQSGEREGSRRSNYYSGVQRVLQREQKPIQSRDETKREQLERSEAQRNIGRHSKNNRQLLARSEDHQILRQLNVCSEDSQEQRRENLSHLEEREVKRNVPKPQRINEQVSQMERHESLRLNNQHYVGRRSDYNDEEHHESLRQINERDRSRHSEDFHDFQRIDKQFFQRQRESIQWRNVTLRRFGDQETTCSGVTRDSLCNNEQELIDRRDENKREREDRQDILRHLNERNVNIRAYDSRHSSKEFFLREKLHFDTKFDNRRNHLYIEDDYIERPTTIFKKGYIFLGQSVILALAIMKTINGKDELKHHLPLKLHEGLRLMSF